jgi:hypothetical protein
MGALAAAALVVVGASAPVRGGYIYVDFAAGVTHSNTTTANVYPPAMYGWVDQYTTGATAPAINEGGSGLNGWVVTDAVAALPNPSYVTELGQTATADATRDGFRFEAYARYVGDYGGAANLGLSMYLNQRAYHLMFDLNAAGDLQATRYGASGLPTPLTVGGTGTAAYHRISLDSTGGTSVTAMFDGQPIAAPWTGISFTQQHANIVLWGASNQSLTARGAMAFNEVTFEIGPIVDLSADFDGNEAVDGRDMLLWQRTVGSTTQLSADANGDRVVNSADLTVWRSEFGASAAALGAATLHSGAADTPEPASAQLALIAVAALSAARRSWARR